MQWEQFKKALACPRLDDAGAVVRAATRLMASWGSNRLEVRQLLSAGVQACELGGDVLDAWDGIRSRGPVVERAAPGSTPQAARGRYRSKPSLVIPLALRLHERTIVEYSRKQGRGALLVGSQLLAAKSLCDQCGCPFEFFLEHLRRCHGINRATCYLLLKFAQWDLPERLGTAVMKWIVQGFVRGSPTAELVVRAAVDEGLTLRALKARYGSLRRGRLAASSDQMLLEQLLRKHQEFLAGAAALQSQIAEVERRLRQRGVTPQRPSSQS